MLSIAPTAARHDAAGELINDHRVIAADDVVDVLDEHLLGLEGVVDVVRPRVLGIKQIRHAKQLLSLGITLIGQRAAALLLVDLVVPFRIDAVLAHLGSAHQLSRHL